MISPRRVLVAGATGYVGGRLIARLLGEGHRVRALAREPAGLRKRPWVRQVEVVQGDALNPHEVHAAMQGADFAYYLIHSMAGNLDFHERDLAAARIFGGAAKANRLERIIYLGGLGDPNGDLSPHLRSRQDTGRALTEAGVPVTELRAAIIVGAGSASFEMIRHLTERIPIMICPRWVFTRVQPIAIQDVLAYLLASLDRPGEEGEVVEIGGKDVLTYGDMMLGYARVRGLRRILIAVPVLSPRLSSYWVHWMTPIPASIARPLIEGLRSEVIVRDDRARRLFPHIAPMGYGRAVELALSGSEATGRETPMKADSGNRN
jgi:uncharacterized protein YbjT (DUF2867 family)